MFFPLSVFSGSPYYDNVRPLCYSDSDAVLLCFDISRPDTVDSSLKKVIPQSAFLFHRFAGNLQLNKIRNPFNNACPFVQWKTEILDFCPSTRILLIGCKIDLRTDVCTLMELSNQKHTPITYEQVRDFVKRVHGISSFVGELSHSLVFENLPNVKLISISPRTTGLCYGQAAGCRGLPGVLRIHLREKHPQRVPHRSDGLHQQAAAAPQV